MRIRQGDYVNKKVWAMLGWPPFCRAVAGKPIIAGNSKFVKCSKTQSARQCAIRYRSLTKEHVGYENLHRPALH